MAKLKYLLDTHAFVWAALEDERLGARAARAIFTTPYEQLGISDVTLQEVGMLYHAGKIKPKKSPAETFGPFLDHFVVLPITLDIALAAPDLKLPHNDPFDRIIAATARVHKVPLLSKDENLADSGLVPIVW
jgi:PIN domain nuclease of toxin-antitoxin system